MIRPQPPRTDEAEAPYEIVELLDVLPAPPDPAGATHEAVTGPLISVEQNAAILRDPLYQAFVATGFFRPG